MNTQSARNLAPVKTLSQISDQLQNNIHAFAAVNSLIGCAQNDTLDCNQLYFLLDQLNAQFQTVLDDLERIR